MRPAPALPSNRSFGWTFTGAFALFGAYSLWHGGTAAIWMLAAAAATALVTLTHDTWLTPLNRAWMKLGEVLGMIVTPIVLGFIFFGIFTPVAFFMRLAGRDTMCRRFEPRAPSYWVQRQPPGPADDSYRNMF
jgi:hypothetical protein